MSFRVQIGIIELTLEVLICCFEEGDEIVECCASESGGSGEVVAEEVVFSPGTRVGNKRKAVKGGKKAVAIANHFKWF